jgi:uncharacterized membrane protein YdjX (TVP38/TMEM64 family)
MQVNAQYNVPVTKLYSLFTKLMLLFLFLLPMILLQVWAKTESVHQLIELIHRYLPLFLISLMLAKAASIVYPPLPGVVFTITAIPLVGWELAYLIDMLGSLMGATGSYFFGQKYGLRILNRVLGKTLTTKIAKVRLKPVNQIEAAIMLRLAAGGLLSDGLAWGASLIGFRFSSFIIGYAFSHVLTTAPVFYALSASLSLHSWAVFLTVALFSWFVIFKFKGRYFE